MPKNLRMSREIPSQVLPDQVNRMNKKPRRYCSFNWAYTALSNWHSSVSSGGGLERRRINRACCLSRMKQGIEWLSHEQLSRGMLCTWAVSLMIKLWNETRAYLKSMHWWSENKATSTAGEMRINPGEDWIANWLSKTLVHKKLVVDGWKIAIMWKIELFRQSQSKKKIDLKIFIIIKDARFTVNEWERERWTSWGVIRSLLKVPKL